MLQNETVIKGDMKRRVNATILTLTGLLTSARLTPRPALAHFDGMDAPVVKAAQKGLAVGREHVTAHVAFIH
jgi:hypothetical protein